MSAQFVQAVYFRTDLRRNAENTYVFHALLQLPAKGVLGLVAGQQDGVLRIADIVPKVMQHTSRLAHARRRDHDKRPTYFVQLLRLAGLTDVSQPLETERVFAVLKVLV